MVINEAFGKANRLPFDLPWRRTVTYSLRPDEDRTSARQMLIGKLTFSLSEILRSARITRETKEDRSSEGPSKAEILSRQTVFAKERNKWLNSEEGVQEVRLEVQRLYSRIKELFDRDGTHHQTIGNELQWNAERRQPRISLIHRGMMAFNLEWAAQYRKFRPKKVA